MTFNDPLIDFSRVIPCHSDSVTRQIIRLAIYRLTGSGEGPQSNLTSNLAQVELAAVKHAAPACSLVSFLPQISGRLKLSPLNMALFSTEVGSYGSS